MERNSAEYRREVDRLREALFTASFARHDIEWRIYPRHVYKSGEYFERKAIYEASSEWRSAKEASDLAAKNLTDFADIPAPFPDLITQNYKGEGDFSPVLNDPHLDELREDPEYPDLSEPAVEITENSKLEMFTSEKKKIN